MSNVDRHSEEEGVPELDAEKLEAAATSIAELGEWLKDNGLVETTRDGDCVSVLYFEGAPRESSFVVGNRVVTYQYESSYPQPPEPRPGRLHVPWDDEIAELYPLADSVKVWTREVSDGNVEVALTVEKEIPSHVPLDSGFLPIADFSVESSTGELEKTDWPVPHPGVLTPEDIERIPRLADYVKRVYEAQLGAGSAACQPASG